MSEGTGQELAKLLREIAGNQVAALASRPHGCVCPPTAEQSCKGISCPRKQFDIRT